MATKEANTRVVMPKGSNNLPNTGYASLPSQMYNGFIVHVFFLEPASFAVDLQSTEGAEHQTQVFHPCQEHVVRSSRGGILGPN